VEHIDLRTRFFRTASLMAEILPENTNDATAISEIQTYLELAPHAKKRGSVKEAVGKNWRS